MYEAYFGEIAGAIPRRTGKLRRTLSGLIKTLEETLDQLQEHAQVLSRRGNKEETAHCRRLVRRLSRDLDTLKKEQEALNAQKIDAEGNPEAEPGVDYGKYRVDRSVPHSIAEELSNRRPAAYSLQGDYREAGTWKQVLVEVCGALNRQDPMLFSSLADDPDLMGRRRPRLSADPGRLLSPARVPDAPLYVETHLSARLLCSILRTLLQKFEIPETDLMLFFEKDYSPLRKERQVRRQKEGQRSGAGEETEMSGQLSLEWGEL